MSNYFHYYSCDQSLKESDYITDNTIEDEGSVYTCLI